MRLRGEVVTVAVAAVAMVGVIGAFVGNASPYVTVAQARKTGGDSLHLAGVMNKTSFRRDFANGHQFFDVKDTDGATINVEHTGPLPASLLEADRVVAIGAIHGDRFVAHDLLVKCPSKYETKSPQPLARL